MCSTSPSLSLDPSSNLVWKSAVDPAAVIMLKRDWFMYCLDPGLGAVTSSIASSPCFRRSGMSREELRWSGFRFVSLRPRRSRRVSCEVEDDEGSIAVRCMAEGQLWHKGSSGRSREKNTKG